MLDKYNHDDYKNSQAVEVAIDLETAKYFLKLLVGEIEVCEEAESEMNDEEILSFIFMRVNFLPKKTQSKLSRQQVYPGIAINILGSGGYSVEDHKMGISSCETNELNDF